MRLPFVLEIPRRSSVCSVGGEAFTPGTPYISALHLEAKEQIVRRDFCLHCWNQNTQKQEAGTYWKGSVPLKEEEKKQNLAKEEKALILLKEAIQTGNQEEAFVLALYLTRKKQLAMRKEIDQTQLYEVLATEEMLAVPKPKLSQLKIADLQLTLAAKLQDRQDQATETV